MFQGMESGATYAILLKNDTQICISETEAFSLPGWHLPCTVHFPPHLSPCGTPTLAHALFLCFCDHCSVSPHLQVLKVSEPNLGTNAKSRIIAFYVTIIFVEVITSVLQRSIFNFYPKHHSTATSARNENYSSRKGNWKANVDNPAVLTCWLDHADTMLENKARWIVARED